MEGAPLSGPSFFNPLPGDFRQVERRLAELLNYSLIRRVTTTQMLIIHRLVQVLVIKG